MKRLAYLFAICFISLGLVGCDDTKDNSYYIPGYGEDTDEGENGGYGVVPDEVGDDQIKVMSFNVRTSSADSGEHAWANRRDACCAIITKENPTIFGVQEARYDQMTYLNQNTNYEGVGVGRDDGGTAGETMGIFYNPSVMTLEEWSTFWLSETPDVAGSQYSGADYIRTATWAIFTHKPTGNKIFYMNTHLDTTNSGRTFEAQLIAEKIPELNPNGYITFLTADFNTSDTNSALSPITSMLNNARADAPVTDDHDTFNGWGTGSGVIDHIFYTDVTPLEFRVVLDVYLNVEYASDHWPVVALFDF